MATPPDCDTEGCMYEGHPLTVIESSGIGHVRQANFPSPTGKLRMIVHYGCRWCGQVVDRLAHVNTDYYTLSLCIYCQLPTSRRELEQIGFIPHTEDGPFCEVAELPAQGKYHDDSGS